MTITFNGGVAEVELHDGRKAVIYENRSGYYRQMLYTLAIEEEIIFTRASMAKIRQYLHSI